MKEILIIDRKTKQVEKEAVYFEDGIRFLYGNSFISKTVGRVFLHALAKWPLTSYIFGKLQDLPSSRKKIAPFIKDYNVDESEFEKPASAFSSFNDFFIRKLKPKARPITPDPLVAAIPADARYQFFETVTKGTPFSVKGKQFSLETLLQNPELARLYEGGSMVVARLCPTDCHRFYFPCDATPSATETINGKLFSVNPIAIKDNPWIYCQNFRTLTQLNTKHFGKVAYLEIGATSVGCIKQTFTPFASYSKGDEKGYFAFGSALIILFEKNRIQFDPDLVEATKKGLEIRCLIGESMGKAYAHTN